MMACSHMSAKIEPAKCYEVPTDPRNQKICHYSAN